ncbi:MAG: hypothetical protein IPJ20_07675 [Flammeovirgaceae bacterium]|nr:hypothetical protein [Flammeovirgaceae bacterium]
MNFLRGILSIGIIIGCLLNWVDVETEKLMFSLSGLTWAPATILLYASVLTAGHSFYNSYRNSNQNSWIYLTCGLYGIGVSIYIYLSVIGNVNIIYTFVDSKETDSLAFNFGIGIYLTGLLSFLLMLTGFDKSTGEVQITQSNSAQQYNSIKQQGNSQSEKQEKTVKPNLQDWLKENPGKSINDYFSKYG